MSWSKLNWSKLAVLLLLLTAVLCTSIRPAYCESEPSRIFYRYINQLYYATKLPPVANYWIEERRVPLLEMSGTRAASELKVMKLGYVYKPKILVEVMDGRYCKMKGSAIAQDNVRGGTVPCTLDVVMVQENSVWKIQFYTWNAVTKRTETF